MRVALLADTRFANHERPLLGRLAVGFVDEIAAATIIEPLSAEPRDSTGPVAHAAWEDRGFDITLNLRVERLRDHLAARERTPDVVHAFGSGAWKPALHLARLTGAALCYEIASSRDLDLAPAAERATAPLTPAHNTNPENNPDIPGAAFTVADPLLHNPLRERIDTLHAHAATWGVHRATKRPTHANNKDRPASVCLITEPGDTDAAITVLHAIARTERHLHAFVDESATGSRGKLWATIEKLKLDDRTDVVPNLEAHRDLTLRCDILALPGPTERARSIILDAMAARLAIAADPDTLIEPLANTELFRPTRPRDIDSWTAALTSAIDADRNTDPTIENAARFADEQRRPSTHIAALINLYNQLSTPKTIAFNRN